MKTLVFLTDLIPGGAQRTIVNLVNYWSSQKLAVQLIIGDDSGGAKDWINPSVNSSNLDKQRLRSMFLLLRRKIKQEKPAVVFTTMLVANFLMAIVIRTLTRRPKLVVRETNSHIHRDDLSYMHRSLAKLTFKLADHIIVLSTGLKQELHDYYHLPASKISVIHNPVDLPDLEMLDNIETRKVNQKFRICSVGRLVRQKGFDLLIEVADILKDDDVEFTIIGEGGERKLLEALIEEKGLDHVIKLVGHQSDPSKWYKNSDLFVLTSRWEGFGHVIVEAMAHGLPVISSDCPYGPADIITHDVDGLLYENGNTRECAEQIRRLIDNLALRGKLALEGKRRATDFAVDKIADQYQTVLEHVAHG